VSVVELLFTDLFFVIRHNWHVEEHKMLQLKHFLLTKPMNYRLTYLARNALKLTYGNLGSRKFSRGETPRPPFKVHSPAKNPGYTYKLGRKETLKENSSKNINS
jgi:hypothetical protein